MKRRVIKIPNSLKEHRKLMGYSQSGVMRKLKLKSTAMISRWEKGEIMPSSDNLLKLSLLYKTLVNELYFERGKELLIELFPDEAERLKENLKRDLPTDRAP